MNNQKFELTIAFGDCDNPNFARALEIAKRNSHYLQVPGGNTKKHIIVYDKSNLKELFEFYNLASDFILYILINGKIRPFTRELWLPMLWFYL